MEEYILPEELDNFRLDKALSALVPKISRSQIQKAIKDSCVKINNVIISDPAHKVKENDSIFLIFKEVEPLKLEATHISLNIIYEDEDLIVINKAVGMTVHPGSGTDNTTLVNALLYHGSHLSDIGGLERPGIVHRLDKDTSGLMVIAKNNFAHANLASQIEKRQLSRKYKALIWGILNPNEGVIKNNIGRSRSDRQKMTILKFGGKQAVTYYKTEAVYFDGAISMVECKLETGRTHQIRVQLSHLKHSVVGDQLYGHNSRKVAHSSLILREKLADFKRQALHSWYISFSHPVTGKILEFKTELPQDIRDIIL